VIGIYVLKITVYDVRCTRRRRRRRRRLQIFRMKDVLE
jgi:hypothetical protein